MAKGPVNEGYTVHSIRPIMIMHDHGGAGPGDLRWKEPGCDRHAVKTWLRSIIPFCGHVGAVD
jgi:hypothetical protein